VSEKLFGYVALFNGRRHELHAASAYAAQVAAIAYFKPAKSQRHLVSVHLAEDADGNAVTHTPAD
jgi:hypothetical protein